MAHYVHIFVYIDISKTLYLLMIPVTLRVSIKLNLPSSTHSNGCYTALTGWSLFCKHTSNVNVKDPKKNTKLVIIVTYFLCI